MPPQMKPVPDKLPLALRNPANKKKLTHKREPVELPPSPRHVWEKLDEETSKSFLGFTLYREMEPANRSLASAEVEYHKQVSNEVREKRRQASAQITSWSRRYRWVERVQAYEEWKDHQAILVSQTALRKAKVRHAENAVKMQDVLIHPIDVFKDRLEQIAAGTREGELDKLSDEDLIKLGRHTAAVLLDVQKAERESYGEQEGQRVQVDIQARGEVLRKVLASREVIGVMETLSFQMATGGATLPDSENGEVIDVQAS